MEFVISCLRTLFYTLDDIVYGLIDDVYGLLMQISRTTIFDQDALHSFSQRVYVMLGLFMLLKVMISIVNYIINPDDLVDKEKGFSNVIKRIILSLVMIVLVPYVFREAYELQAIVLSENTIMTIIFGTPGEDYRNQSNTARANSSFYDTAGQKIQFTIMYAFAQPNYEEFSATDIDLFDCRDTYQKDKDGNFIFRDKSTVGGKKKGKSNYIYALNESCFGTYDADKDEYTNGQLRRLFEEEIVDSNAKFYQNYAQGVAQQNFTLFFRKNVILAKTSEGKYAINYKWGVSTAVGVAVVYLLLIFCVDIAGRSIKLGFLQLISPIPILSYCDPKSGKDGMFKKWYTMCFKAYAELFIKLFALYFGIYIISLVGTFKDVMTGEAVDNWLVSIFMIIGVLIFVKKLPEIIKDALGVDLGGKLELNPLKKLENEAFGGKAITGAAAGAVVGGVGNAASRIQEEGVKGLLKSPFSLVSGAVRGASHGVVENKGLKEQAKRQADMNRKIREARLNGTTFGGRKLDKLASSFGAETPAERFDRMSKSADAKLQFNQTNLDFAKNTRSGILDELRTKSSDDIKKYDKNGTNTWENAQNRLRAADAAYQAAQQSGNASAIATARDNLAKAEDDVFKDILDHGSESARMKADREKYNVRVKNNPDLARDAHISESSGPISSTEMKNIKDNSQINVNNYESEVYRYKNSSQASQYQADKTYNETTKFQ